MTPQTRDLSSTGCRARDTFRDGLASEGGDQERDHGLRRKTIAAVRDYIAAFLDANLQGRRAAGLLNGLSSDYLDTVVTTQEQALCR
jgi:hypothetical protein